MESRESLERGKGVIASRNEQVAPTAPDLALVNESSKRKRTVCYGCRPPNDWGTIRALKEHQEKMGH